MRDRKPAHFSRSGGVSPVIVLGPVSGDGLARIVCGGHAAKPSVDVWAMVRAPESRGRARQPILRFADKPKPGRIERHARKDTP